MLAATPGASTSSPPRSRRERTNASAISVLLWRRSEVLDWSWCDGIVVVVVALPPPAAGPPAPPPPIPSLLPFGATSMAVLLLPPALFCLEMDEETRSRLYCSISSKRREGEGEEGSESERGLRMRASARERTFASRCSSRKGENERKISSVGRHRFFSFYLTVPPATAAPTR